MAVEVRRVRGLLLHSRYDYTTLFQIPTWDRAVLVRDCIGKITRGVKTGCTLYEAFFHMSAGSQSQQRWGADVELVASQLWGQTEHDLFNSVAIEEDQEYMVAAFANRRRNWVLQKQTGKAKKGVS